MEKQFHLSIMTPVKTLYDAPAVSLVAPGVMGAVGILADHAPFVALTKSGVVTIREPSGALRSLTIQSRGVLEVMKNEVSLLLSETAGP